MAIKLTNLPEKTTLSITDLIYVVKDGLSGKMTVQNAATAFANSLSLLIANNLSDLADASAARTNIGLNTTVNQTDSVNKRFMSDAQETILDNTSNTNTGDQDLTGYQLLSGKDAVSGYAGLDGTGKINPSQLPSIAVTDTFVVASEAAMLALTVEVGDVAVRTDIESTFILRVAGATVLANWTQLQTPTDAVASVFGRSGIVTAQSNDYSFSQLDNIPTTVAGYGITDAYTKTETDGKYLLNTSDTFTGDLTVTGDVIADTHFNSSDSNVTLSTTGAGTVFLRPNGKSDTTGQTTLSSSGDLTVAGDISATDGLFSGDVTLEDNGKALFGTGGDLEIYHDGAISSYIKPAVDGTHQLNIGSTSEEWNTISLVSRRHLFSNADGSNLMELTTGGDLKIGGGTAGSKLHVEGGIQMADDTDTAALNKKGALRYRTSGNNSYLDICMQTGAGTYAWINITTNAW